MAPHTIVELIANHKTGMRELMDAYIARIETHENLFQAFEVFGS